MEKLDRCLRYNICVGSHFKVVREYWANQVGAYYTLVDESLRMIDVETGEVMLSSFCCEEGYNGSSMIVEIADSITRKIVPDQRILNLKRPSGWASMLKSEREKYMKKLYTIINSLN